MRTGTPPLVPAAGPLFPPRSSSPAPRPRRRLAGCVAALQLSLASLLLLSLPSLLLLSLPSLCLAQATPGAVAWPMGSVLELFGVARSPTGRVYLASGSASPNILLASPTSAPVAHVRTGSCECLAVHQSTGDLYYGTASGVSVSRAVSGDVPADLTGANVKTVAQGEEATTVFFDPTNPNDLYWASSGKSVYRIKNVNTATLPATPEKLGSLPTDEGEAFGAIDQSGVLILAGYWNLYKYPSARSLTVGSIVATGNVNKLCSMTDITQHFSRGHRAGVVLHSSRGATVREVNVASMTPSAEGNGRCTTKDMFRPPAGNYATQVAPMAGGAFLAAILRNPTGLYFVPGSPAAVLAPMRTASDWSMRVGSRATAEGKEQIWCNLRDGAFHVQAAPVLAPASGSKVTVRAFAVNTPTITVAPTTGWIGVPFDISATTPNQLTNLRIDVVKPADGMYIGVYAGLFEGSSTEASAENFAMLCRVDSTPVGRPSTGAISLEVTTAPTCPSANPPRRTRFTPASPINVCVYQQDTQSVSTSLLALDQSIGAVQRRPIGSAPATAWGPLMHVQLVNQTLSPKLLQVDASTLDPSFEYRMGFTRISDAGLPALPDIVEAALRWTTTFHYLAPDLRMALDISDDNAAYDGCRTDWTCRQSTCARRDTRAAPVKLGGSEAWTNFALDWLLPGDGTQTSDFAPHRGRNDNDQQKWNLGGTQNNGGIAPANQVAERWVTGASESAFVSSNSPLLASINITLRYSLPVSCNPYYVQVWLSKIAPGKSGRTSATNPTQACYSPPVDGQSWDPHVIWHSEWLPVENWRGTTLDHSMLPSSVFQAFWHVNVSLPGRQSLLQVNEVVDVDYEGIKSGAALYVGAQYRNWDQQMLQSNPAQYDAIQGVKYASGVQSLGCSSRLAFHWMSDARGGNVSFPLSASDLTEMSGGDIFSRSGTSLSVQIGTTSDLTVGVYSYTLQAAYISPDNVATLLGSPVTVLMQEAGFTPMQTLLLSGRPAQLAPRDGGHQLEVRMTTEFTSGLRVDSQQRLKWDFTPPTSDAVRVWLWSEGEGAACASQPNGPAAGTKVYQSNLAAGVRVCMSGAFADAETAIASVRYAIQFRAAGASTWPSSFTSEFTGDWLAISADSAVSALRTVAARLEDGYEYRLGLFAQNGVGLPIAHTDADAFPFYVWTSNSLLVDLTPPTIASGQQPFMFLGDTTQEQLQALQTIVDVPSALTASTRGPSASEQWFIASLEQLRVRTLPSYQVGSDPLIQWSDPESGISSLVQMAITDSNVPPSSDSNWATTGTNPPSELALASLLTPSSGSTLQPQQGVPMYVHVRYLNRAMLASAAATRPVGVDLTPPDMSLTRLHATNPDWTANPTKPITFVEYPRPINLRWTAPVDTDSNVRLLSLVVRNADGSVKSQARYVAAAATSLTVSHASLPAGLQQAGTQLVLELSAWNGAHLQTTTSLSLLWDVPRPGTSQMVYDGLRAMERQQLSFYTAGQVFLAAWFDFAFINAPVDSYTVTIGTEANPTALLGATVFAADVMNVTIDDVASVPSVECSRVFTRVVARVQNSDVTIQAESTGQLVTSQPPSGGSVFDLTTLARADQDADFTASMSGLAVSWSGFSHACLPLRYVVRLLNSSASAGEEGVLVVDQETYGAPGTSATHDAPHLSPGEYVYEVCAWANPMLSRCVRSDGFHFDPSAPSVAAVVVRNGPTGTVHEAFNPSLSVVRANWQGWSEPPSGIRYFLYRVDGHATAVYTPSSGWINAGTASQVVLRNAGLVAGQTYHIHVAAVSHAGVVSDVASSQPFVALAVPPVPLPLLEAITAIDVDGRPLTLHYATSWQSLLFNDSSLAVSTGALSYRFAIGSSSTAPTLHTKTYVRVPVNNTVRDALSEYFAGVERDHTRSFLTDGNVWVLSVTAINAIELSSNRVSEGVQLDQSAPHCAAPYGLNADGVASSALPTLTSLRIGWSACTDDESPLMVEEVALSLGADDYTDRSIAGFQRYRYQQGAKRQLLFGDLPADKVSHGSRVHIWLRATNAAGLQTLRHSSVLIDTQAPAAPLLEPVHFGAHALASASSSVVALPQRVVACQRDNGHLSISWHAFSSLSGVHEYRVRLLDGAGELLLAEQSVPGDRTYAELDEAVPGQLAAAAYVYAVISATSRAGVSTDPAGALVGGVYVAREGDAPLSTRGVLDASVRLSEARGDDTNANVVHGVFVNVTLDGVFSGMVHQLVYSIGSSEGGAQLNDWTIVPVATQVHDFVSRQNASGGVREYGAWLRLGPLTVRNNEAFILTLKASTCAGAAVLVSSEPMLVRFALPDTAAPTPSAIGVSVSSPLAQLQLQYPEVADLQSASPRPGVAFVTRAAGATSSDAIELSLELSGLFYDPAGLLDITATLLHANGTALQQSSEAEAEYPSVRRVSFAEGAASDALLAPLLLQLDPSLVSQGACYRIDLLARSIYDLTASISSNVCIDLSAPLVQLRADESEPSAIIALEPLPPLSSSSPSSSSVLLCTSSATSLHVHWRPLLAPHSYVAIMSLCVSSQVGVASLDASVALSASGVCDVSAATSILPEGQPTSLHLSSLNMKVAGEYVVWIEAVSAVGLRTYVRSLPIRPVLQAPLAASELSSNKSDDSVAASSSSSSAVAVQIESSLVGAQADGSWFFGSGSTFNLSWSPMVSPDGGPIAASWTLLRDGDVRGDSAVLPWQSLSGDAIAARSVLLHAELAAAAAASSGAWPVRSGVSYRVALRVETCSGLASLFLSNRLVASVHAPVYGVASLTNLLADPHGSSTRFYASSDHIEQDGLTLRFGSFVDAVAAISHYNVVLLRQDGSEVIRLLDAFKPTTNETQQLVKVPLHDDNGQPLLASVTLVPQATSALSDLFELRLNGSASLAGHLRAAVSASGGAALRLRIEGANVLELVRGVEVELVLDDAEPDWFAHVRLLRDDADVPAGQGAANSLLAETDEERGNETEARCVRAEQLDARRLLVQWASDKGSAGSSRARAPVRRVELALEVSDGRLATNGTELVTNVTIAGEQVSFVRACALRAVAEWPMDAPMLQASEKGHVLSFARLLEGDGACMMQDGALHRLVMRTINVLGRHSDISGAPFFFVRNPMILQQLLVDRSSLFVPSAVSGSWASDAEVGNEAAHRVVDLPLAVRPWPLLVAVLGQLRFAVGVGSTPTNDAYLELREAAAAAATSLGPSAVRLLSRAQVEENPDAWRQLRVSSLPSGSDVLLVRATGVPASVDSSPLYVQAHATLLSCGGMRMLLGSGSSVLDLTPPELDDSQTVPALKPTPVLLHTNLSADAARIDIWPTYHSPPHIYVPHTQPSLVIAFQPWRDSQHGVQRYEWAMVDGQQARLSPVQLVQEARNANWQRLRIPAQIDLSSDVVPAATEPDASGAVASTSGSNSDSAQGLQWVYLSAITNQPVAESEYRRWANSSSADAADNLPVQWLAFEWPASGVGRIASQLPVGQFTLLVRGIDGAGGAGDAVRVFLTVDDTPPHLPVGERITHGSWPLSTPPTPSGEAATHHWLSDVQLDQSLGGSGSSSGSVSGASLSSLLSSRVVSVRCQRNATTHISWPRWVDDQSGGVRSERVAYRTAVVQSDSHSLTPQTQQRILDQLDGACDASSVASAPKWMLDEDSDARVARVLQCWTAYEDGALSRGLVSAATSLSSSSSTGAVAAAASAPSSGGLGSEAAWAQAARLPGARLTASFTPSPRLAEPVAPQAVLHWLVEARNAAGLTQHAWSGGVTLLCGQSFYGGGGGGDVSAGGSGSASDPLDYETLRPGACVSPAQLVPSRLHCMD